MTPHEIAGTIASVLALGGSSILYFVTKRDFYGAAFSSDKSVAHNVKVRKHNAMVKKVRPIGFALIVIAALFQIVFLYIFK